MVSGNAIVKASKEVKGVTATVRRHLDAVERAREIYLAQIKRAESDYFERIKCATEAVAGPGADTPMTTVNDTAGSQIEALAQ